MYTAFTLCALSVVVGATPSKPGTAATTQAGQPVVPQCTISLVEEVQIPAQEAGVLKELQVREGQVVKAGTLLGKVDDTQAQIQLKAAIAEYRSAKQAAENDINVRFAKKAAEVAQSEYKKTQEAVRRTPGSISDVEVERLRLSAEKAVLQIEQSEMDLKTAKYTLESKLAQGEAADNAIERRKLAAPFDGEIRSIRRHVGDWVQPGEPVVHVMRLDRLRVEGFLSAAQWDRAEIKNRPVLIEVTLARGRTAKFEGRVDYVSIEEEAGGEYRIRAEIDNRKEGEEWVLYPGQTATMTIATK